MSEDGLEVVRKLYTGVSMSHGVEGVTTREKLCEAWPGEAVQSERRPVGNTAGPLLAAMKSYPSQGDVVALLRELGCAIRSTPLLGPTLEKTPLVVGDGEPVTYRLRLTVNGKGADEAEIRMSFRDGR